MVVVAIAATEAIIIINCLFVCLMVFNTPFNNISVISWWSVLLVEETGGPVAIKMTAATY